MLETETKSESQVGEPMDLTPGRTREHIEPAQFAALRDELGLTNKEFALAIDRTPARVSELTYSKGASIDTWEWVEKAVREYADSHPRGQSSDDGDSTEGSNEG